MAAWSLLFCVKYVRGLGFHLKYTNFNYSTRATYLQPLLIQITLQALRLQTAAADFVGISLLLLGLSGKVFSQFSVLLTKNVTF
jgi:hypothetical protein